MIEIIPTIVPGSLDDVVRTAQQVKGFASALHIDVADGIFAPNTTWMPLEGEMLPKYEGFLYEAHLMVADPKDVGIAFVRAGAARVIGHIEAMGENVDETFAAWRQSGAQECILGTLFDTPVERLAPFAAHCDTIMFMSITTIGVQGLPADPNASAHAAALRTHYPEVTIEVDGAISEKNIASLVQAGVQRFCVGSAISKSPDPASTYRSLMAFAESAVE